MCKLKQSINAALAGFGGVVQNKRIHIILHLPEPKKTIRRRVRAKHAPAFIRGHIESATATFNKITIQRHRHAVSHTVWEAPLPPSLY
jgi:hypothetical protein